MKADGMDIESSREVGGVAVVNVTVAAMAVF